MALITVARARDASSAVQAVARAIAMIPTAAPMTTSPRHTPSTASASAACSMYAEQIMPLKLRPALRNENLVATVRIHRDPRTGERFKQAQGRLLYRNGFSGLRSNRGVRSRDLAIWAKAEGFLAEGPRC
jgi:hypothetical protein